MRFINQAGLDLIEKFESLQHQAYQDAVGIWTIGYGHTGHDVKPGLTITTDAANDLLQKDLEAFSKIVIDHVKVELTDNQFAALVSLAFNIGANAWAASTLLRKLNEGNYTDAANEFLKWTHAGKKELLGLVKRRSAERDLFLS